MASSGARSKLRRLNYAKYGYLFILPFFLTYIIFSLYPLLNTFYLATTRDTIFGTGKGSDSVVTESVGLANFTDLLGAKNDYPYLIEEVRAAFANTVEIWLMNFFPQILLSLVLAVWFTDARLKVHGKGFYKVMIYMPNVITAAAIASLFMSLFGDSSLSPVNGTLLKLGLVTQDDTIRFLTDLSVKRVLIAAIQCWMWYGNTMIILIATINGINPSLFEAAQIDGASSRQQFFRVTLPLIKPMMLYTLITSMIGGLQMYDVPYLLKSGTALVIKEQTIAVLIFDMFRKSSPDFGMAATISVLLFVVTLVLSLIIFYVLRDKDAIAQKKYLKKLRKQQVAKASGRVGGLGI